MQKILAIDDKSDNLVTMTALLNNLMPCCTMITAQSGREGIEKAISWLPDVILLDVKMPDMDGFETCRRLKAEKRTKQIPVIMITAIRTDPLSRIKGLEIGADAFLSKPIDEHELVSQIKVALRIKKAEDALKEERDFLEKIVQERTTTLRESEIKLQAIFDTVGTGIIIIDRETQVITEINQTAVDMIGLPKEKIIGHSCHSVVCPAQMGKCPVKDLGQDIDHSECKLLCADGRLKDILKTVYPIIIKGRDYYLESFIDISDRLRAEELLKEGEERFHQIFDNMADGVAIYRAIDEGSDFIFVDINRKGQLSSAISHSNAIGKRVTEVFPAVGKIGLLDVFRQVWRTGEAQHHPVSLYEDQRIQQWVENYIFKLPSGLIVALYSDITDRRKAEEEKQSLEERLQRAEKMEALGTLAGGVAHDLNNVLGIVVGYAEMVLDDMDKSSPIRHELENIMKGGQRAAAIVDDLLTMARRGVPGRKVVNLNRIIADCQKSPEFANISFHHPSVKIRTDLEPDLLNISGSTVHLSKTIYNLIANASEAMAKGGGVTIKTTNQYLDKPIQGYDQIREGDYVVLSVSDTGEGIPAGDLKRIFEPFYTKKIMGRSGTGLGLAVVWGTIKDHHGYINVESSEGKGTTLTLYFPVTREDFTEDGIDVPISEYMGKGETILIVDDIKEQRDLATGMLSKLNYKVVSVASGEDAVAYLKEGEADLMVLDMIMDPGMDGLDTYQSVLEIRPQQKAIIVSGFSESERAHTAQDLGAGTYVRKPYIKEKLGLAVRSELDRDV